MFKIQNVNFQKLYKKSSDFVLVYPDGRLATTLPDSSEKFSIDGYRNFLDPKMKYDRLRLYLCTIAFLETLLICIQSYTLKRRLSTKHIGNRNLDVCIK